MFVRIICPWTPRTEEELCVFWDWNLEVWASRVHPYYDHLGRPIQGKRAEKAGQWLADGWGAGFAGWTGDLKEEARTHSLTRNFMCNFFCKKCLGSRDDTCNGYDFRRNRSPFQQLLISHQRYLGTSLGSLSPWCRVRGWTIYRNREDGLHQKWLGWGKDVIGESILQLALLRITFLKDLDDAICGLWKECIAWFWDEHGMSSTGIKPWSTNTISWHSSSDFATLAAKIKGAQARLIFKWIVHAITSEAKRQIEQGDLEAAKFWGWLGSCIWSLWQYNRICHESGIILTVEQAEAAAQHGHNFCCCGN